jgi:L-alanine-DL-glutamate epimerase-like enolase superfamily enzyme
MKITGIRTQAIDIPFPAPIGTSIHRITGVAGLLVWVDTDEGVTGESYLWAIGGHKVPVLDAMVRALEGTVIGKDPRDTEALYIDMWREINFLGHKGVTIFGIAAIDCACWDIKGKAAGMSVGHMLGRARDRVKAYASGGLWASMSIEELQAQAKQFVADGFKAVKMRIGLPDITVDLERIAAVREAIGPSIDLMADANQGLTVNHAIRLGRGLEKYNLVWFEEPVQAYDLAGSARVAEALDTPIASGETEYTRYGFQDILERGSADILMPDLERVGGVSEWLKVANMAAALDVPVSPHIFTEHSLQLCAAAGNVTYSEHMPWFTELFQERMEMVDGNILIPDRPGMGFTFDPDAVRRFAV